MGLKPPDRNELKRHADLERLCGDLLAQVDTLGFTFDELLETFAELQSRGGSKSGGRSE